MKNFLFSLVLAATLLCAPTKVSYIRFQNALSGEPTDLEFKVQLDKEQLSKILAEQDPIQLKRMIQMNVSLTAAQVGCIETRHGGYVSGETLLIPILLRRGFECLSDQLPEGPLTCGAGESPRRLRMWQNKHRCAFRLHDLGLKVDLIIEMITSRKIDEFTPGQLYTWEEILEKSEAASKVQAPYKLNLFNIMISDGCLDGCRREDVALLRLGREELDLDALSLLLSRVCDAEGSRDNRSTRLTFHALNHFVWKAYRTTIEHALAVEDCSYKVIQYADKVPLISLRFAPEKKEVQYPGPVKWIYALEADYQNFCPCIFGLDAKGNKFPNMRRYINPSLRIKFQICEVAGHYFDLNPKPVPIKQALCEYAEDLFQFSQGDRPTDIRDPARCLRLVDAGFRSKIEKFNEAIEKH